MKVRNNGVVRRDFLKGVAVGTGAVVTGGIMSGCTPKQVEPVSSNENVADSTLNEQVSSGKLSFEIAPDPITDGEISETKEADVIVVGAGTSGLCTALAAAEAGAKVILFASSSGPVGRGGSNFAANSKYMESLELPKLEADPYLRIQLMSNYFDVDVSKWYKWYNHSEEAMNWLIDHMENSEYELRLEQGNRGMDPANPAYTPSGTHAWISEDMQKVGNGQPLVVETLANEAAAAGVEVIYNVEAQQLIREDDNTGRVSAVIGKDVDGNYIKFVGNKGVVLAMGDFSVDGDMMAKYCPQGLPFVTNIGKNVDPTNGKVYGGLFNGQGHKMGLWVGAAWQKTYPNAAMIGAKLGPSNLAYNLTSTMIVNQDGNRFFSEEITGGFMSGLMQHQPGLAVYSIWDVDYAEAAKPWYLPKTAYGSEPGTPEEMVASWDAGVEDGSVVKADTLEELVELMGLPASTLDEIEKYNGFCESGLDTDFYKRTELLKPIKQAPFYGASAKSLTFLTVMGGLRTNINMQVCEEDDTPIPGLFNVGTMVGDMYAGCYSFQIPGFNLGATCVTFGYLTGRAIANDEI